MAPGGGFAWDTPQAHPTKSRGGPSPGLAHPTKSRGGPCCSDYIDHLFCLIHVLRHVLHVLRVLNAGRLSLRFGQTTCLLLCIDNSYQTK